MFADTTTMNCIFADPTTINKIIDALADGVETLNLYCTKSGINVAATNACHTDMREVNLEQGFFKSYQCTADIVLGVHMPTLKKFMHTAGSQDIITWSTHTSGRLLCITIEDTGENKSVTNWDLKLIEYDEEALAPPPNPAFRVGFRVSTVLVSTWLNKCKILGGNVKLGITKGKHITIEATSDMGAFKHCQPIPSVMATVFQQAPDFTEESQTISSKEAEYLSTLIKCAPGIDLQIDPNLPLTATSYLDAEQTSFFRLWIAPMATDDYLEEDN
jgi:hypothetical protein